MQIFWLTFFCIDTNIYVIQVILDFIIGQSEHKWCWEIS